MTKMAKLINRENFESGNVEKVGMVFLKEF